MENHYTQLQLLNHNIWRQLLSVHLVVVDLYVYGKLYSYIVELNSSSLNAAAGLDYWVKKELEPQCWPIRLIECTLLLIIMLCIFLSVGKGGSVCHIIWDNTQHAFASLFLDIDIQTLGYRSSSMLYFSLIVMNLFPCQLRVHLSASCFFHQSEYLYQNVFALSLSFSLLYFPFVD